MARREFLALGQPYAEGKHNIAGYYMSEKLDGVRCFWDGGLSRDVSTGLVPWAGVLNPKTGQPKTKVRPVATGLWSRYGNPIMAPDWFLNKLPACPLDGELYAGRGRFQDVTSYTGKDVPIDEEWARLEFVVFSTPNLWSVMQDGEIVNSNQLTDIRKSSVEKFIKRHVDLPGWQHLTSDSGKLAFSSEIAYIQEWLEGCDDCIRMAPQTKLPMDEDEAYRIASERASQIVSEGGEGIILRNPHAVWTPKRTRDIVKMKGCFDDEGVVVGFTSGRKTTKGSKLLGMIGALILNYNGERLELAGLTNEERQFDTEAMSKYAADHPGQDMPAVFQGKEFKVGDLVTFNYRELSKEGIPKEARYFRKRVEV